MKRVVPLQCCVALILLSFICLSTPTVIEDVEESDNTDFTNEEMETILQTVKRFQPFRKGMRFQKFIDNLMGCFRSFHSKGDSNHNIYAEFVGPPQIPRPPSPERPAPAPLRPSYPEFGYESENRPQHGNGWSSSEGSHPNTQGPYHSYSDDYVDPSDDSVDYYYNPSSGQYVYTAGKVYYEMPQQKQYNYPQEPPIRQNPHRSEKCIPVRAQCLGHGSHNGMSSSMQSESSSNKSYYRRRIARSIECCAGNRCTNGTCCVPAASGRPHSPCSSRLDCCDNGICDIKTKMCFAVSGSKCDDNKNCMNTQCTKNICCNPSIGIYDCEKSSDCCAGACKDGKCKADAGESCQDNFQCVSNKCLNDFCQE